MKDEEIEHDGEVDPEDKDLPKTPVGEKYRIKRRAIKQRLREGQLVKEAEANDKQSF